MWPEFRPCFGVFWIKIWSKYVVFWRFFYQNQPNSPYIHSHSHGSYFSSENKIIDRFEILAYQNTRNIHGRGTPHFAPLWAVTAISFRTVTRHHDHISYPIKLIYKQQSLLNSKFVESTSSRPVFWFVAARFLSEWNLAQYTTHTQHTQQFIFRPYFSNTTHMLHSCVYTCTHKYTHVELHNSHMTLKTGYFSWKFVIFSSVCDSVLNFPNRYRNLNGWMCR